MSGETRIGVQTHIGLLGPFALSLNGVPIESRIKGSARRLFIYLLIHQGERHRREHLAEQISPDEGASRSAFNTTLWRLKKGVSDLPGVHFECDRDSMALQIEAPARLDVDALLEANSAIVGERDPSQAVLETLQDAVESWRGEFADGLSSDWALLMRERMHNCYLHVLTTLMRDAGRNRRFDAALDYALRILDEDPFRESTHCEVMWLLVLNGQRAKAITRHREFRLMLKRELGIGPMPETTALHDYICNGLEAAPDLPLQSDQTGASAQRYRGLLEAVERSRESVYTALQTMFPAG